MLKQSRPPSRTSREEFLSQQLDPVPSFSPRLLYITEPLITPAAMSLSPASHCAICHSQHQTNHSRNTSGRQNPPTRRRATEECCFHGNGVRQIRCIITGFSSNVWKQEAVHSFGGERGSGFHTSAHSSGRHFTWFPRKNYNKSGRHGAEEDKEKRKRARMNSLTTLYETFMFEPFKLRLLSRTTVSDERKQETEAVGTNVWLWWSAMMKVR